MNAPKNPTASISSTTSRIARRYSPIAIIATTATCRGLTNGPAPVTMTALAAVRSFHRKSLSRLRGARASIFHPNTAHVGGGAVDFRKNSDSSVDSDICESSQSSGEERWHGEGQSKPS